MFDDPRKSLNRLQRELLAAEEQEIPEELEELLEEEWDEDEREPLAQAYSEEEYEYEEEYADVEEPPAPPKRRRDNTRGLITAMILEFLGLLVIAGWWFLCR